MAMRGSYGEVMWTLDKAWRVGWTALTTSRRRATSGVLDRHRQHGAVGATDYARLSRWPVEAQFGYREETVKFPDAVDLRLGGLILGAALRLGPP